MFKPDDRVKVEYSYGKFYEGTVLWTTENYGVHYATVRPDDPRYIATFGFARDMTNGYKSYVADGSVRNQVFLLD